MGEEDAIKGRVVKFVNKSKKTSDYDKEKLQERVAKAGGVAVIKVGAATEVKWKKKTA